MPLHFLFSPDPPIAPQSPPDSRVAAMGLLRAVHSHFRPELP